MYENYESLCMVPIHDHARKENIQLTDTYSNVSVILVLAGQQRVMEVFRKDVNTLYLPQCRLQLYFTDGTAEVCVKWGA